MDAPRDLLEKLEAVREGSNCKIRLIRSTPPGYEFVHDQMNAYLAACWFCDHPSVTIMRDLLSDSKVWQDARDTQQPLWEFVVAMLDRVRLEKLWNFAEKDDRRFVLRDALANRDDREGWPLKREPKENCGEGNNI